LYIIGELGFNLPHLIAKLTSLFNKLSLNPNIFWTEVINELSLNKLYKNKKLKIRVLTQQKKNFTPYNSAIKTMF
jgi:hypothetical protein